MAKTDKATNVKPPPDSDIDVSQDERETEPVIETPPSALPAGVQMHETGVLPNTTNRDLVIQRDPKMPPPGWKGTFHRCGGCGDFIGNSDRCPKCTPAGAGAPYVVNHPNVIA